MMELLLRSWTKLMRHVNCADTAARSFQPRMNTDGHGFDGCKRHKRWDAQSLARRKEHKDQTRFVLQKETKMTKSQGYFPPSLPSVDFPFLLCG
jgi:hypothetical protein